MKLLAAICFLLITQLTNAQDYYMLVGTYDSPLSEGIHVFLFDSKTGLTNAVSTIKTPNPSFITVSPDQRFVYAVSETAPQDGKGGDIAAFSFNRSYGTLQFINKQLSGGDHPCHVETDRSGKWLFVSNYSSGSLSTLAINEDGSLGKGEKILHSGSGKDPGRQKSPHVHGAIISADNRQLMVTDLGMDKLMCYSFNSSNGKLTPSHPPYIVSEPGSGPRLFTFHPNNRFAYMIEELSGTVVSFSYKKGKLKRLQRISTMPAGDSGYAGSADVHVSPDGRFLYASNRGDANTIAIYSIDKKGILHFISHQSTLGKTPRNFSIDPTGKFLLCENQNSNEIVVFSRDNKTGLLTDTGHRVKVGKPVCIKWIAKEKQVR